jgi:hypothetical protein
MGAIRQPRGDRAGGALSVADFPFGFRVFPELWPCVFDRDFFVLPAFAPPAPFPLELPAFRDFLPPRAFV